MCLFVIRLCQTCRLLAAISHGTPPVASRAATLAPSCGGPCSSLTPNLHPTHTPSSHTGLADRGCSGAGATPLEAPRALECSFGGLGNRASAVQEPRRGRKGFCL
mmetsp:Transcript_153644/g.268692  ORF Transcript_153644/g.268692 Transcript_153644/m.268692 type:complete len:105 (+) Transcript_153644:2323-2637(+)